MKFVSFEKSIIYPGIIVLVGLALLWPAYHFVVTHESLKREQVIELQSDIISKQVQASLDRRMLQIASIANLFSSSNWVSSDEFDRMVNLVFLDKSSVQRLSYIANTSSSEVKEIERKVRETSDDRYKEFTVFDYDYILQKRISLRPNQKKIMAILYDYPKRDTPNFIGRNIGKYRQVYQHAMTALRLKKPFVGDFSRAIPAVHAPHFFIMQPVLNFEKEDEVIVGFVAAANLLNDVFDMMRQLNLSDSYHVNLIDSQSSLYELTTDSLQPDNPLSASDKDRIYDINVGEQQWKLIVEPIEHPYSTSNVLINIVMLSSLLFIITLAILVRNSLLRQSELSQVVYKKTTELRSKNESLEQANIKVEKFGNAKSEF